MVRAVQELTTGMIHGHEQMLQRVNLRRREVGHEVVGVQDVPIVTPHIPQVLTQGHQGQGHDHHHIPRYQVVPAVDLQSGQDHGHLDLGVVE